MAMARIWVGMMLVSLFSAVKTGNIAALTGGMMEGANSAVTLCLHLAGMLCLWMGIMEILQRSGLAGGLARLLSPLLRRLFPQHAGDKTIMETLSANVSANLLGLGNAATPLGLQTAKGMSRASPHKASDALCMLVVCNTASIQLLPTTVATVRMGAGCETPFDILPAVWLASALSVGAGICACLLCRRLWRLWEC